MAKNIALHRASKAKQDEFYTQFSDIEAECSHYREHFKGKTILCNCDDPETSEFWRYFYVNFETFKLKKLISTHFVEAQFFKDGITYKLEYCGGGAKGKVIDFSKCTKKTLKTNGDFRNDESIGLLKEADIVITNPPFSLFREYLAQLIEYQKLFLIIGSMNAITYKEVFRAIRDNKVWLGYGFAGGNAFFRIKAPRNFASGVYDPTTELVKFRNVHWFTNLNIKKRHDELKLWKAYTPQEFPKYDNYDAINVDKVAEIPVDYDGAMGVPITFLDKYNPDQFEIIGISSSAGYNAYIVGLEKDSKFKDARPLINGKNIYARIFIKKKKLKGVLARQSKH